MIQLHLFIIKRCSEQKRGQHQEFQPDITRLEQIENRQLRQA